MTNTMTNTMKITMNPLSHPTAKRATATGQTRPIRVGYIVRSFPRLSQTFILNEVLELEASGVQMHIFSCTHPHEAVVQPQVADVQAQVNYLEEGLQLSRLHLLWQHLLLLLIAPRAYCRTLLYVLRHSECDEGYTAASRFNCFLQAVYLAQLLRQAEGSADEIDHLHAHFAHDPTLIAQLVHFLTGIPFTFTAHARDIYQIPAKALAERIQHAEAVVTCCALNVTYFKSVVAEKHHAKLHVIHNGINLADFRPQDEADIATPTPDAEPPLLLSASRLVEKKGFFDLLAAYQQLKERGQHFRGIIYGDGPLEAEMAAQIKALGLDDHVTLAGLCTQQELRQMMPKATLFALTPFVTEDGDRDGVPTVLAEAMACGVPVVSTTVAGIPELVTDGHNGLLAAPHQINEIADNLILLLNNENKRRQLGKAARNTIVQEFNLQNGVHQLAQLYRTAVTHHDAGNSTATTTSTSVGASA